MLVKELIKELEKLDQDKIIGFASIADDEVDGIINIDEIVEIDETLLEVDEDVYVII